MFCTKEGSGNIPRKSFSNNLPKKINELLSSPPWLSKEVRMYSNGFTLWISFNVQLLCNSTSSASPYKAIKAAVTANKVVEAWVISAELGAFEKLHIGQFFASLLSHIEVHAVHSAIFDII